MMYPHTQWTDGATRVLLFTIRLAVHVESYMLFLLRHAQWRASGDDAVAQPGGFASVIRGLATVPGALDTLRTGQVRTRDLLVRVRANPNPNSSDVHEAACTVSRC